MEQETRFLAAVTATQVAVREEGGKLLLVDQAGTTRARLAPLPARLSRHEVAGMGRERTMFADSAMFELTGKACVVTGASRGLGRAIGLAFAEQGADVMLAARSVADLERVREEVVARGRRAVVQPTNVADVRQARGGSGGVRGELRQDRRRVKQSGGDTSIAGGWSEWLDVTEEGWERMLRLNLKGQVFGAQAAARAMRAQGTGGSIIFLSFTIDSLYAAPGGEGIYGACKAAINNVTQTMAVELGQHGIRVNGIAPAVVETPLTATWLATPEDRRRRSDFYPLRRVGQPADVAAAAVSFASDEAAWVSGAILLVSGGAVMTSDPYRYLMRVNRGERV